MTLFGKARRLLTAGSTAQDKHPPRQTGKIAQSEIVQRAFAAKRDADRINATIDRLQDDLRASNRAIEALGDEVRAKTGAAWKVGKQIEASTRSLLEGGESAQNLDTAMQTTFSDIQSTGNEVEKEAEASRTVSDQASDVTRPASDSIAELNRSIRSITDVTAMISDIVSQTTLLALNATIEAARSGEAGRGFAVVASEVKALSAQTQKATEDIQTIVAALNAQARQAVDGITKAGETIGNLSPGFERITAALDSQLQVKGEIEHTAGAISGFLDQGTREVTGLRTNDRFVILIRNNEIGDRRRHRRLATSRAAILRSGAKSFPGATVDLSEGGLLFKPAEGAGPPIGATFDLSGDGLPNLSLRVAATSALGCHCAFVDPSEDASQKIKALLQDVEAENRLLIDIAQAGAAAIADVLQTCLSSRRLAVRDLFDSDYKLIPGSDPRRYDNRAAAILEKDLSAILEPIKRDNPISCCFLVDRNGFAPVHNTIYSQEPRPDDPLWNASHCRNRMIFDDRAGILAARNTEPYLIQLYSCDMGDRIVMTKDISAPVIVNGRHWGGLRVLEAMQ